jgi:hypothetical protein
MPAQWQAAAGQTKQQATHFQAILAAQLASAQIMHQSIAAHRTHATQAAAAATSWQGIARSTGSVATNIARITSSLIGWTALTGAVTGLLGAGGLFGLERMASGVAMGRRSAMGLGVSFGQQAAFGVNFGRFVDPGSMLGNVAGGLSDVTSDAYRALLVSGVSTKGTPADVSARLLEALPRIFRGVSKDMVGTMAGALGLTNILPVEDIRRYLAAGPGERGAQSRAYRKDIGSLELKHDEQLKWQNFTTALDRAGGTIWAVLVRGLTPLEEPLENLSGSFVKVVEAFADSGALKDWIGLASKELERFAVA